jgi:hypothetical protein
MAAPYGFKAGTSIDVTYTNDTTRRYTVVGWGDNGILAQVGTSTQFIPFNNVLYVAVTPVPIERIVVGDYTRSIGPSTITVGDYHKEN